MSSVDAMTKPKDQGAAALPANGAARGNGNGSDLSVGQRLAIGFGLLLTLLIVLLGTYLMLNQRQVELQHQVSDVVTPRVTAANRVTTAFYRQAVEVRNYIIGGSDAELQAYHKAAQRSRAALADLEAVPKDPDGQALFSEIAAQAEAYTAATDGLALLRAQAGGVAGLENAEKQVAVLRVELMNALEEFAELQYEKQEAAFLAIDETQAGATRLLILLSILMVGIGSATAIYTARSVQDPVRTLLRAARSLAGGDYGPARALYSPDHSPEDERYARPNDELRELSDSFGFTARLLWQRENRLAARNRVASALAAGNQVDSLASETLRETALYAGCQYAALYLRDETGERFHRVAGYAAEGGAASFAPGEGIPGEAARSRRTIVVRDIPAGLPFRVGLGVDALPPRTVVALPVVLHAETLGVLVYAGLDDVSADAVDFLERSAEQLAVSLRNALASQEIARLATELQERNEELSVQNEELQAQSEEIQAQSEELQAQSEELQAQNEQLRSHAELLGNQKVELELQREALLEADRMKDEFLSVASHELRGPITSLKGFTQLLLMQTRKQAAMAKYADHLSTIDRQADLLVARIRRLLEASRARMGKLELQTGPADLVSLLRGQIEQAQVRSDDHQIVFETDAEQVVGHWDREYIGQVAGNLLENAVRYSPEGGEIKVTLQQEGGEARFSVADNGIGIPEEAQRRLFKSYFRDESASKVSGEGMGIGLYITAAIVQAHGGRIWCESEPGRGSTFHVALPLVAADADDQAADGNGAVTVSMNPYAEAALHRPATAQDHLQEVPEQGEEATAG
jgi:signal transduction histidine kinase/CHASE3 domain sensor protein